MAKPQLKESITINIRAKSHQRDLIDVAAEKQGCSRSEFMLKAACREAQDVLLDQAYFSVGFKSYIEMQKLLDEPLPANDKLRRLLKRKAPWDK